jgi:hypothetical protein
MITSVESGVSAPTLTLPRKRERGPTDIGARESISHDRPNPVDASHIRQSLLPLPRAGEGWGGGAPARANFRKRYSTAGAAS